MSDGLNDLAAHVAATLDADILESVIVNGELTLTVKADDIVDVVTFLRDDPKCRFVSIIDICGADYPARPKRFDVVYHLLSPYQNQRIRVKVQADEDTLVPSITGVY